MPYILNKTDGSIISVVPDASLDVTTDLIFVGRNYAGYGEVQNENFLKLLENFSNTTPPLKPIEGQLWFDKNLDNKKLNVYDGNDWKTIANLEVSESNPFTRNEDPKSPKSGDLWYNKLENQLYVFDGGQYVLIGPLTGADTQAGWRGDADNELGQGDFRNYNIKAIIGSNPPVAIVSANEYTVQSTFSEFTKYRGSYQKIFKGITLNGADKDTGISENEGIYFWGSASHSLRSNTSTNSLSITSTAVSVNSTYYLPFVNSLNGASPTRTHTNLSYNPFVNGGTLKATIFDGVATRARYADLAERYAADKYYSPGTVVVIGGEKEITISTSRANPAVAGVISQNPAYMMNSQAGPDETHPYVALKGRVICKVRGKIRKGDRLVTGFKAGHAEAWQEGDDPNSVFAKALENFDGVQGLIEVKI